MFQDIISVIVQGLKPLLKSCSVSRYYFRNCTATYLCQETHIQIFIMSSKVIFFGPNLQEKYQTCLRHLNSEGATSETTMFP